MEEQSGHLDTEDNLQAKLGQDAINLPLDFIIQT